MTQTSKGYFWLKFDTEAYHSLAFEHEADAIAHRQLDSTEANVDWIAREVSAVDTDDELAVFGDFISLNWHIVLSERARVTLRKTLEANGEILPLLHSSRTLWAYRVTAILDAFDFDKSVFQRFASSGRVMSVSKFVLRENLRREPALFRLQGLERMGVIAQQSFVDRVSQLGLTGCVFAPVA